MMIINHNLGALNAEKSMTINSTSASKSMEKLSSGLRINKAGDDAAGLAISEKMRGQIRGLDQASANAQNGISMIGTAEGVLNETSSMLLRMRELAVQGANDTNTPEDMTQIQKEMNQLTSEISRIGNETEFNTQKLLNGSGGTSGVGNFTFQIGANEDQHLVVSISDMRSSAIGLAGSGGVPFVLPGSGDDLSDVTNLGERALDVSDSKKSAAVIQLLDATTALVSAERAQLGAYSNRLEHVIANLGTSSESLVSAESRIRDVNMAKEMSAFSKNNILSQAAQAMLAQANQQPQQILQLLK